MNRLVSGLIIGIAAACCRGAQAVPTAYYNPATGGLYLKNEINSKLAAIAIFSESVPNVAKNDPALYASIPGAQFDAGDLPLGFTYLSFPSTGDAPLGLFIGNVITLGTPTSALTGVWYLPFVLPSTPPKVSIIEIPEPPSGVIATLSATAGAIALRSRARRNDHSPKYRLLRITLAISAAAFGVCSTRVAQAAPTAYYNPATGGIHLKNDTSGPITVAVFSSTIPNVAKTDPSLYASIPGAIFDPADLPLGFTYLNFPATGSDPWGRYIGNVISPGVPTSALAGNWWNNADGPVAPVLNLVEVPEPFSCGLAIIAGAIIAFSRRSPRVA